MGTRITIEQLEQMTTHELADLLANVVMLLRRLPDVEWQALQPSYALEQTMPMIPAIQATQPLTSFSSTRHFTEAELKLMKVDELKKIAEDLNIIFTKKIKKDEIIAKLIAWQVGENHSEQYNILHL